MKNNNIIDTDRYKERIWVMRPPSWVRAWSLIVGLPLPEGLD